MISCKSLTPRAAVLSKFESNVVSRRTVCRYTRPYSRVVTRSFGPDAPRANISQAGDGVATAEKQEGYASDDSIAISMQEQSRQLRNLTETVEILRQQLYQLQKQWQPQPQSYYGSGTVKETTAGVTTPGAGAAASEEHEKSLTTEPARKVQKLTTKLTDAVHHGYLSSVTSMRGELMEYEWELLMKGWAARKGVARFERHCVDSKQPLPYEIVSKLYQNPGNLEVIDDESLRMLARSMIYQELEEGHREIYKTCTETAHKMVQSVQQAAGAGGVSGPFRTIFKMVLPPFMK